MLPIYKKAPEVEPPLPDLPLAWAATAVSERGPRPARFTKKTRVLIWSYRIASVAAIAIGIPIVLRVAGTTDRLVGEGQIVQAEVIDQAIRHGKRTTYEVTYRYTIDWVTLTDRQEVSSDEYSSIRIGGTVPVTFIPQDPQVHRYGFVSRDDAKGQQLKGSLVVMALSAILGLIAQGHRKSALKQVRMLREWRAFPAQAIRLNTESAGKSGLKHTVRYRLRRSNGSVDEFTHSETGNNGPRAEPGDMFTVMVDPSSENDVKPLWDLEMVEVAPEGTPVGELHT